MIPPSSPPLQHIMRFNLKVPFAEKDAAKQLGARWDAAHKLWYVEDKADMTPFAKWSPTPRDASASSAPAVPGRPAVKAKAQTPAEGIVQVGSRYVELPRVCTCLPWEDCDKCRAVASSWLPKNP
jgi:hypothetical protein